MNGGLVIGSWRLEAGKSEDLFNLLVIQHVSILFCVVDCFISK